VAVRSFETSTKLHGAIFQNTQLFMNIIVKTTNLAYRHSQGKRMPEDLGVFVTKMVSLRGINFQSKISQYRGNRVKATVKC